MVGVSSVPNLQLWWLLACSYDYKKTTLHFDSKTGSQSLDIEYKYVHNQNMILCESLRLHSDDTFRQHFEIFQFIHTMSEYSMLRCTRIPFRLLTRPIKTEFTSKTSHHAPVLKRIIVGVSTVPSL